MLSIELAPEIEQRLRALAKRTGKTEAELASNPGTRLTSQQVRRELGLDD